MPRPQSVLEEREKEVRRQIRLYRDYVDETYNPTEAQIKAFIANDDNFKMRDAALAVKKKYDYREIYVQSLSEVKVDDEKEKTTINKIGFRDKFVRLFRYEVKIIPDNASNEDIAKITDHNEKLLTDFLEGEKGDENELEVLKRIWNVLLKHKVATSHNSLVGKGADEYISAQDERTYLFLYENVLNRMRNYEYIPPVEEIKLVEEKYMMELNICKKDGVDYTLNSADMFIKLPGLDLIEEAKKGNLIKLSIGPQEKMYYAAKENKPNPELNEYAEVCKTVAGNLTSYDILKTSSERQANLNKALEPFLSPEEGFFGMCFSANGEPLRFEDAYSNALTQGTTFYIAKPLDMVEKGDDKYIFELKINKDGKVSLNRESIKKDKWKEAVDYRQQKYLASQINKKYKQEMAKKAELPKGEIKVMPQKYKNENKPIKVRIEDKRFVKDNIGLQEMIEIPKDVDIFQGGMKLSDIKQNFWGTCFMLAPIRSAIKNNPEEIKDLIRDNHDGTVTATFYYYGDAKEGKIPVEVTIDKSLPKVDGEAALWVRLYEKAFAAVRVPYMRPTANYELYMQAERNMLDGINKFNEVDFLEMLFPYELETHNVANKFVEEPDLGKAKAEMLKVLQDIDKRKGIAILTTKEHVMQFESLSKVGDVTYVNYYDQFDRTYRRISIDKLFGPYTPIEGIHIVYPDNTKKADYYTMSPKNMVKDWMAKHNPEALQFVKDTENLRSSKLTVNEIFRLTIKVQESVKNRADAVLDPDFSDGVELLKIKDIEAIGAGGRDDLNENNDELVLPKDKNANPNVWKSELTDEAYNMLAGSAGDGLADFINTKDKKLIDEDTIKYMNSGLNIELQKYVCQKLAETDDPLRGIDKLKMKDGVYSKDDIEKLIFRNFVNDNMKKFKRAMDEFKASKAAIDGALGDEKGAYHDRTKETLSRIDDVYKELEKELKGVDGKFLKMNIVMGKLRDIYDLSQKFRDDANAAIPGGINVPDAITAYANAATKLYDSFYEYNHKEYDTELKNNVDDTKEAILTELTWNPSSRKRALANEARNQTNADEKTVAGLATEIKQIVKDSVFLSSYSSEEFLAVKDALINYQRVESLGDKANNKDVKKSTELLRIAANNYLKNRNPYTSTGKDRFRLVQKIFNMANQKNIGQRFIEDEREYKLGKYEDWLYKRANVYNKAGNYLYEQNLYDLESFASSIPGAYEKMVEVASTKDGYKKFRDENTDEYKALEKLMIHEAYKKDILSMMVNKGEINDRPVLKLINEEKYDLVAQAAKKLLKPVFDEFKADKRALVDYLSQDGANFDAKIESVLKEQMAASNKSIGEKEFRERKDEGAAPNIHP